MPNLDNSELIHAFGDTWKNHKYIKKIGNRYFYSMDELRNYNQNVRKGKAGTTSKAYVSKERRVGTIGSTGVFKKKQSIGDAFTSGIKSVGKKISDATGETERKRAEAAEQLSGILAKKTAYSKKELDTASQNRKMADLTARKMREKAQLYEDEAAVSKAASDYKSYSRAAANDKKAANTETEEAKNWRLNANTVDNLFTKQYSRDVASAQKKYEADLKAYEAVLSEAQAYREQYGNTVSGKLEKAANDVQRAYNDVVQSASEAIDAGKQFAKEQAAKVSTSVSELTTKASDSVASGLAWVESIFAPKKKK